jgi:hypothetical protein
MTETPPANSDDRTRTEAEAIKKIDESFDWYRRNAKKSRNRFQIVEVVQLVTAAAIPPTALLNSPWVPAVLGALVVVLTGLRPVFRWHENYIRFTEACQELLYEKRRFDARLPPYGTSISAESLLVEAVNRVEAKETGAWIELQRALDKSGNATPSSRTPKEPDNGDDQHEESERT